MHPTLSFTEPPFLPLPNEEKKELVNLLAAAIEER